MASVSTVTGSSGIGGTLRLTWMHDRLAHILEHCATDEASGTWTGLACPDHGLAIGSDVDNDALWRMCASGEIADMIWEAPADFTASHRSVFDTAMTAWNAGQQEAADRSWQQLGALWSHAWAASYSALDLMQRTGISKFSPLKPQRWVVASFEHHTSPHGLPQPHIHNLVITRLTTGPG